MSALLDALWCEGLRYAYVLSALPWPDRVARGAFAVVAMGAAVAAWRIGRRRGQGGLPSARARLRFDSPAGHG